MATYKKNRYGKKVVVVTVKEMSRTTVKVVTKKGKTKTERIAYTGTPF